MKGHDGVVKVLIAAGIDVHAIWGPSNALDIATVEYENSQFTVADLQGAHNHGFVAILRAKEEAYRNIIQMLREAGAVPTHGHRSGWMGLVDHAESDEFLESSIDLESGWTEGVNEAGPPQRLGDEADWVSGNPGSESTVLRQSNTSREPSGDTENHC
ncbi:hypothetical protein CERZMDRAFT_100122 [Cercospora zeae-maydis SCOH1-5]|uniref:Uncharacterized protein n=1 Tax=Cercospora zeae-maydis SCOH1-5 TaxID=717836 RepID=A0A6A6F828_9PEZI|nr:hypothetical protein CERZMDRAFT_100122 [Cercospora zeae-maydis SCOH1-5]